MASDEKRKKKERKKEEKDNAEAQSALRKRREEAENPGRAGPFGKLRASKLGPYKVAGV